MVVVALDLPVTDTVPLWARLGETEFVVDGEPVAELLSDSWRVPETVGEMRGVPVRWVETVFDTDTVEVLELEGLFVVVCVLMIVRLPSGLVVVVLDAFNVAVPLGVAVGVFVEPSVLE
jgi:hypothetical protein